MIDLLLVVCLLAYYAIRFAVLFPQYSLFIEKFYDHDVHYRLITRQHPPYRYVDELLGNLALNVCFKTWIWNLRGFAKDKDYYDRIMDYSTKEADHPWSHQKEK